MSKTGGGSSGAFSRSFGGRHAQCWRVAKEAAIYPSGLCQAVIKGITEQLREDRLLKRGCFGVQVQEDEKELMRHLEVVDSLESQIEDLADKKHVYDLSTRLITTGDMSTGDIYSARQVSIKY